MIPQQRQPRGALPYHQLLESVPGQGKVALVSVSCRICAKTFKMNAPDPVGTTEHKIEVTERKLTEALSKSGWTAKPGLRRIECPDHQAKPEIISMQTPIRPSIAAVNGAAVVTAPAPASATQADRRKISDELDAAYDATASRYRGTFSDEALARKLAVPRAWVTEVREFLFGPERNENDDRIIQMIAGWETVKAECEAKIESALELLSRMEKDIAAFKSKAR